MSLYRVCHPRRVCGGQICHGQIPATGGPAGATLGDMSENQRTTDLDQHIYQRLLWQRIVVLRDEIKDENANALCAQLVLLNAEDPKAEISLYINSPGGSVSAGLAILDTMNFIGNEVSTYAMGLVASMGQVLLACGAPGKRFSLPHARIMMHQPSGGMGGTASDIKTQAEQSLLAKRQLAELLAERTGQSVDRITEDFDRDRWFTPEQALDYGIIDRVLTQPVSV
jgi:ATP-dependent Clp protease protease subunit